MNPSSHSGRSSRAFKKIFELLDNSGVNYQYRITESIEDAYNSSVEANQKNYDAIIAVGGDGTINVVLNGFYEASGKRISKAKFGVIYTGTSPDFCKSYNIPTDLSRAVEVIITEHSEKILIGKVTLSLQNDRNFHRKSIRDNPRAITRFFGCCANIGLGASLARKANSGIRRYLGDFAGTFLALASILPTFKPSDQELTIDRKRVTFPGLYNISIGRTRYIASGIKVEHSLGGSDRRFYYLSVKNLRIANIPSLLRKVYSGKPIKNTRYLELGYCREIKFPGNYNNPEVEFDGDPAGFLPCRIEIAEDPLDLFTITI
jgi:diacylglycerol kinase family enzyme